MSKKTRRTAQRVVAAAGMALAVGAANAVVIDGPEGIGDKVWEDLNMNGVQDAGEPGVAGVTVNLLRPDTTFVSTTSTDALGEYWFRIDGTGSGGLNEDFVVEFVLPGGFVFSPQFAAAAALDSNADPLTGLTDVITITDFVRNLTVDAGIYREPSPGVPEPAALSLLGLGLAGLGFQHRRRRKSAA